jgi:hypothetical protein
MDNSQISFPWKCDRDVTELGQASLHKKRACAKKIRLFWFFPKIDKKSKEPSWAKFLFTKRERVQKSSDFFGFFQKLTKVQKNRVRLSFSSHFRRHASSTLA